MGRLTLGCALEEKGQITFGGRPGSRPQEAPREGDTAFQREGRVPWTLPGDGAKPPAIWPCQEEGPQQLYPRVPIMP